MKLYAGIAFFLLLIYYVIISSLIDYLDVKIKDDLLRLGIFSLISLGVGYFVYYLIVKLRPEEKD